MYFKYLKHLCLCFVFSSNSIFAANIGLLIVATGKYITYVDPLIASAEKHFCQDHNVTYFVFTDSVIPSTDKVIYIFQQRLGWPFDTMMRGQAYYYSKKLLAQQDYLFACDADMRFVGPMGDEILGDRVATLHAWFDPSYIIGRRGTYETNPKSTAYVAEHEGDYYFAGGFYGGSSDEFLKMTSSILTNIYKDLSNGLIAIWHDESHWNRYCIDHPPTVILSSDYCFPEEIAIPGISKLLALLKPHEEIRTND